MQNLPHVLLSVAISATVASHLAAQTPATNTVRGAGCLAAYASYYEHFATSAAFDLNHTTVTMIPSAGGYFVLAGTAAYLPPSAAATTLALGDDSEVTVPLPSAMLLPGGTVTSLTVCSNGYVAAASGNGAPHTPIPSTMLAATRTAFWNWHDYDPTIVNGGRVKFEQVGAITCITWDGVWDFNGASAANANTFQFQFDTSSGIVHLVVQTVSTLGNARLVGYSPGGPSADPGSMDLSTALPASFSVRASDVLPLTLAASTRPITGSTWSLDVTNIPAASTLGVDIVGFTDPGLDNLTSLGLPGCGLRSSLEVISPWSPFGTTHSYSLAIPANPALVNRHLYTTAAVFVPGVNAFGALTANGMDGTLGDI